MSTQKQKFELFERLRELGFTYDEAQALRRIEMTLHRWAEQECGDSNDYNSWCITRDEKTGKPFMEVHPHSGKMHRYAIADRETGALKRLKAIVFARNDRARGSDPFRGNLIPFHQGDPRGCALYLVNARDLEGNRIVEKAESLGFTYFFLKRSGPTPGVAVYTSPQIPGREFTFPEQGAIWFLKSRNEVVPESRNLPIESYYTRGLAVCA